MIHLAGTCAGIDSSKFINFLPDDCVLVFDDVWYCDPLGRKLYLILQEPDIICPYHTNEAIKNIDKYEHVYTFNSKILLLFPNKTTIYLGNYATVQLLTDANKKFSISGWASTKIYNNAPGHLLRLDIYNKQLQLPYCKFFRSSSRNADNGPPLEEIVQGQNPLLGPDFLGGGKSCLFDEFQFSIIIENSQQENYFTEKIIDCLITKTIPIYWGCPNISEFFDTTGWLFFDSFESLLQEIHKLDETYYKKFINIINKNYQLAFKKKDFYNNILHIL